MVDLKYKSPLVAVYLKTKRRIFFLKNGERNTSMYTPFMYVKEGFAT